MNIIYVKEGSTLVHVYVLEHMSAFTIEPLDGCLRKVVEMRNSWSHTSVKVFRPDPPMGGSRVGLK